MKAENIVKEVCAELGINQAELAERLGVTTGAISKWNTREMPKMAEKALELMLENHKQKQQLQAISNFYKTLQEIDKSH